MEKQDDLGVPRRKNVGSGSTLQSSAKKRKDLRSDPSRIESVNKGVWHLCVLIGMNAAAAIYKMDRKNDFHIIHALNKLLKTDVLPVGDVFHATGIAAKNPQPKARIRSVKPGSSSSRKSPK